MAETIASLQQNHNMRYPFTTLDPKSLIFSQFSQNSDQFHSLQLKTESFERGPRYKEYAARRESHLRMKQMKQSIPVIEEEKEELISMSPPKKQVKFQLNLVTPPRRTKGSSVLTQSVPDFSSALRKENRRPAPASMLPTMMEKSLTPPLKSKSGNYDSVFGKVAGSEKSATPPVKSKGGNYDSIFGKVAAGSKSANSGRRQSGGFIARKSCANLDEFKGLASQAKTAINVEARGMKNSRLAAAGKSVFANRQF